MLSIKRVNFRIHTHNQLLEKARQLSDLIERFKNEEAGWKDNTLLQSILGLAKECGDTTLQQDPARAFALFRKLLLDQAFRRGLRLS